KRLLDDTPVAVVAWGVNALSLPLLAGATLVLHPLPRVDRLFWLGLVGSAALNLAATLLSTQALKLGDASLVTPILTFNPAFTLVIARITLGETPSRVGIAGVFFILLGGYVLTGRDRDAGWLRPFELLLSRSELCLALGASFIWGLTPVTEKLAIEHSHPANPPIVAFGSTALMVLFLFPLAWRSAPHPALHLASHRRGFLLAAVIAGIAPVFGFTAVALGLVGYVSALFKISTVFSIVWAVLFLGEKVPSERAIGSALMVVGAILVGI
ncbi:MAG: EamA family transporter, partial [Chloroflexota bacterium]